MAHSAGFRFLRPQKHLNALTHSEGFLFRTRTVPRALDVKTLQLTAVVVGQVEEIDEAIEQSHMPEKYGGRPALAQPKEWSQARLRGFPLPEGVRSTYAPAGGGSE